MHASNPVTRVYEWVHLAFCLLANAPMPSFWSFCRKEGRKKADQAPVSATRRGERVKLTVANNWWKRRRSKCRPLARLISYAACVETA